MNEGYILSSKDGLNWGYAGFETGMIFIDTSQRTMPLVKYIRHADGVLGWAKVEDVKTGISRDVPIEELERYDGA
jgi:hypothetical protein